MSRWTQLKWTGIAIYPTRWPSRLVYRRHSVHQLLFILCPSCCLIGSIVRNSKQMSSVMWLHIWSNLAHAYRVMRYFLCQTGPLGMAYTWRGSRPPLGMAYTWRGCGSPWGWPTRGGAVGPPGDGLHVVGL